MSEGGACPHESAAMVNTHAHDLRNCAKYDLPGMSRPGRVDSLASATTGGENSRESAPKPSSFYREAESTRQGFEAGLVSFKRDGQDIRTNSGE